MALTKTSLEAAPAAKTAARASKTAPGASKTAPGTSIRPSQASPRSAPRPKNSAPASRASPQTSFQRAPGPFRVPSRAPRNHLRRLKSAPRSIADDARSFRVDHLARENHAGSLESDRRADSRDSPALYAESRTSDFDRRSLRAANPETPSHHVRHECLKQDMFAGIDAAAHDAV